MSEFRLVTERFVLRPWRESDKPEFAAIMNTPGMTRHLGGVQDRSEIDLLVDKRMADQARDGLSYWAVEARESGGLVGSCGLRMAHDYAGTPVVGMVEAGWRVAEAWWRKGVATETMRAVFDWGARERGFFEIATWTVAENLASQAVMRRLGFVPAPWLDFDRPGSGERCLVQLLDNRRSEAA